MTKWIVLRVGGACNILESVRIFKMVKYWGGHPSSNKPSRSEMSTFTKLPGCWIIYKWFQMLHYWYFSDATLVLILFLGAIQLDIGSLNFNKKI